MSECYSYAAQMHTTMAQLAKAIREAGAADAQRCRDAIWDPPPEMAQMCRMVSINCGPYGQEVTTPSSAPYQAEFCQVTYARQTNLQECIRQVQEWHLEHPDQGAVHGIFSISAVKYAQDAGGALPGFLTHATPPMVSAIAEWGSKAIQAKQYYNVAQSLLKLSSPTLAPQDRSNLMQSLGLTAAQSMPNVNPISSILMAVGVDVLNGIYLKNMQTLQSEFSAFDSSLPPAADPNELNLQPLYAEATPAGYQDVANTVSQLEELFSPDSRTYVGSEISRSTRTQQSEPGTASRYSSAGSSAAQAGTDCESAEAPIVQECMQPYYGSPCAGANVSVSCFRRALRVGAGICSDSVMAGYRQSLEQAREAVAFACR